MDDLFPQFPELKRHWKAVLQRLRESGHVAGSPVNGNSNNRVVTAQPFYNGPMISLAWIVYGDTVTIVAATL